MVISNCQNDKTPISCLKREEELSALHRQVHTKLDHTEDTKLIEDVDSKKYETKMGKEDMDKNKIRNMKLAKTTQNWLDDIEEAEDISMKEKDPNENLLENRLLQEHMRKTENKDKYKNPMIKSVESVNLPASLFSGKHLNKQENPSTSWADIAARLSGSLKDYRKILSSKEKKKETLTIRTQINKGEYAQDDKKEKNIKLLKSMNKRNEKTAAIVIQGDENTSYTKILRKAKSTVSLEELDIGDCKVRKGFTGGLVIKIPGANANYKADAFAEKLSTALKSDAVRIRRPVKKTDIKIMDLEESTTKQEIVNTLSALFNCSERRRLCERY